MFNAEDKAGELVDKSIERYEKHFNLDFPLYTDKFLTMLANDEFDISIEGAKILESFINNRIKENKPLSIPDDYYDIVY